LKDFDNLSKDMFKKHGGTALLNIIFRGSLYEALQDVYSSHQWFAWNFLQTVPRGYWDQIENQRNFLDWFGKQFRFDSLNNWYGITAKQIIEKGGAGLLHKYNDSVSSMVMSIFEEYSWNEENFVTKILDASNRWNSIQNQRTFLEALGKKLGYTHMNNWYDITWKHIVQNGGRELQQQYDSVDKLIMSVFPDFSWKEWRFKNQHKFLDDEENHRRCLDELGIELGIKHLEDWINVRWKDIAQKGGSALVNKYGGSLFKMLNSIYPAHTWNESSFNTVQSNEKKFLIWLSDQLGLKTLDDWYQVTVKKIRDRGGSKMLEKYGNSPYKFIMSVYPHHEWKESKFKQKLPNGYWNNRENQIQFLKELGKELGTKSIDDWSVVSAKTIQEKGGAGLLNKYGGSITKMIKYTLLEDPHKL
jgi:hypothetical protein